MSDIFNKDKRSEIMSRIRGKDTKVERLVFSYLRKEGTYFRKHYRTKEGITLDIALPRKRRGVFIDGDFWHGRDYENRKEKLKPYWRNKLERNIQRDKEQTVALQKAGWEVLRVWEKELIRKSTQIEELNKIVRFLTN